MSYMRNVTLLFSIIIIIIIIIMRRRRRRTEATSYFVIVDLFISFLVDIFHLMVEKFRILT
jgi:hypothetical protein